MDVIINVLGCEPVWDANTGTTRLAVLCRVVCANPPREIPAGELTTDVRADFAQTSGQTNNAVRDAARNEFLRVNGLVAADVSRVAMFGGRSI